MRRLTWLGAFVTIATLALMKPTSGADENSWPMYGKNLRHTFANPQSEVMLGNVASLQPLLPRAAPRPSL
jgi:hypothetical protein